MMTGTSDIPFGRQAIDRASRPARSLVLHADDFGMTDQVNTGIMRGFSHGLLTSTSLLANAPGCAAALSLWKNLEARAAHNDLPSQAARRRLGDTLNPFDLGIHLNLTQGRPLTGEHYPAELLDREGRFPGVFALATRLMVSRSRFRPAIEDELCTQIEVLLENGIAPTHLNAHQYVDLLPAVAAIVPRLLRRYAIPVVRVPWETHLTRATLIRRFEPANWLLGQIKRVFAFRYLIEMSRSGALHPARFFGTSHAGRIDRDVLRTFVEAAGSGLTEIGMHPGLFESPGAPAAADGWNDPLDASRAAELSLLTSAELADFLEAKQIRLGRLQDLWVRPVVRIAA